MTSVNFAGGCSRDAAKSSTPSGTGGPLLSPLFSRRVHATVLSVAAGLGISSLGSSADACSCEVHRGFYETTPGDGAVDVPTNVSLLAWVGAYSPKPALLDDQGTEVEVAFTYAYTLSGCQENYELDPTADLLPNHTYRLVLPDDGSGASFDEELPHTISFTTGSGPLEGGLISAPKARLVVFKAQPPASCVSRPNACLAMEAGLDIELLTVEGDRTTGYVARSSATNPLSLSSEGGEVCVRVRTRDLAGNLSEPFEQCVEAADAYEYSGGDFPNDFCLTEEIQALLNGEMPTWGDAGPTPDVSAAATDSLPAPDETGDPVVTAGQSVNDDAATNDFDTNAGSNDFDTNAGNDPASVLDPAATASETEAESEEPSSAAPDGTTHREPSGIEMSTLEGDTSDSGCSVITSRQRGPSARLGMLLTAFVVTFGRRIRRREVS